MALDKNKTIVAYRCPHCGSGVMSMVDVFKLSASMVKIKCTCRESEMSIIKQNDDKIKIEVPCILCPKPHSFVLSESVFFGKDEFLLQCPYSDLDACFLGESNRVQAHLSRNEYQLIKMMEEEGITDFAAFRRANQEDLDEALDSELTQSVIFILSELEAENKIFCRCEHKEEIDEEKYGFEVHPHGVLVKCRDCGGERLIPTDNSLNTHAFLDADALYLE